MEIRENAKETASSAKAGILGVPRDQLSPGMQQYQDVKKEHPDCLVMLRMGDFFEMFYEDALTASKELEITLTARGKGEKRAPLAGVPYHALDVYLSRLVKKGYKVALVEQLEDPKKAKGLVKRGLVRIVTPGTVLESSMLQEKENNYIMSLTSLGEEFAAAFCDISTGEFFTLHLESLGVLLSELARQNPTECIVPESLQVNQELMEKIRSCCFVNPVEDHLFREEKAAEALKSHFNLFNLESLGLPRAQLAASGALLRYMIDTQKSALSHLKKVTVAGSRQGMLLDPATLRNLELLKNSREEGSKGTLLSVLDKTITPLGARLLRQWVKKPLLDLARIQERLAAVEELHQKVIPREEMRDIMQGIYDLERLISRVSCGSANPRDVIALKISLKKIPLIKERLQSCQSQLLKQVQGMDSLEEIAQLLEKSLREDAPILVREGGIIKPGYNSELDQLYSLAKNSKKYLQQLEEQERIKTGITSLRISYTQVFGYFIEVTKKNVPLVPGNYLRKQTTTNSERYITEELKNEEEKILGAQEKMEELEYNLFQEILQQVADKTREIQDTAVKIAVLDVLCSLAKVAMENGYVRPEFTDDKVIQIKQGRHPVIEQMQEKFVPNDLELSRGEMMIITGPNMAGKSTLQRQAALMVLMAQMGSFVPAEKAVLGIVDRVFTRVGAQDALSAGHSTFMVEMSETANILNNATADSLIILDEIGRGTSTFDGVSLAWSVAEHIHNHIKAKTLFSTHYHVLNKLAEKFSRIRNYNLAVKEARGEVTFLYKLVEGGTDESYGIHVAQLAGLPEGVIERAKEIQSVLEKDDEMMRKIKAKKLEEQKGLEEF